MPSEETFPLDPEKIYYSMDELTLDTETGPQTMRVGAWLNADPVRIHRLIIKDKVLQVNQLEVYMPLMSKLRRADPDYYKKFMGYIQWMTLRQRLNRFIRRAHYYLIRIIIVLYTN